MKKIRFGKTNLMVSRVAFGGIPIMRLEKPDAAAVVRGAIDLGVNFIDTANAYNDSEEKIGEAIRGIRRDSLVIASKSMAGDKKTFLEHLDKCLISLGTDYVDIYQMHNVATPAKREQVFGPGGAYEGLCQAVKAGKVRFPGFSSHSIPLAMELMKTGFFATVQLPFNFVDSAAAEEAIPLARKLDMGFIAMKPMGGGLLDNADIAFRYLMQFDNIVPDPGIEKLAEMEQIVGIVNAGQGLSAGDQKTIDALRKELGDHWCHRCDYCQPCPQGIAISAVLTVESTLKRMPFERAFRMANAGVQNALTCVRCNACVKRCPYKLPIPDLLKTKIAVWNRAMAAQGL
jgi:predicted aldo/keto reductase-like oxidoreductase